MRAKTSRFGPVGGARPRATLVDGCCFRPHRSQPPGVWNGNDDISPNKELTARDQLVDLKPEFGNARLNL